MRSIGLLLTMLIINGCSGEDKPKYYDVSDISELSYELAEDSLSVSYSLVLETLYYSPGVNIKIKGNDIIIDIIRCNVNDECSVDILTTMSNSNKKIVIVREKVKPSRVYINRVSPETSVDRLSYK
ncbi:hypothetical protein [Vibrio nereis]|uniref:hypothetical protein n=1 Tax=Vibrio nereis TaxID=693 RepID=UPI002494B710|nr:hypothetical protein [Vibrio nereis]